MIYFVFYLWKLCKAERETGTREVSGEGKLENRSAGPWCPCPDLQKLEEQMLQRALSMPPAGPGGRAVGAQVGETRSASGRAGVAVPRRRGNQGHGYTIRQPEVQGQRGGPRPPAQRHSQTRRPPQGSLTFRAASRHHTWGSPAPLPLNALTVAGRNTGEGSQSTGLRAAPSASAPYCIPRSLRSSTSLAPPQRLRPAPPSTTLL